ncbi:hypothetical protein RFN58_31205 [Streptomyces iakyrus]|nr:hypothetical protein [Streptomyces iakyrus]
MTPVVRTYVVLVLVLVLVLVPGGRYVGMSWTWVCSVGPRDTPLCPGS